MSDNTELKNKIESAWENITKISPNDKDIADAVNEDKLLLPLFL